MDESKKNLAVEHRRSARGAVLGLLEESYPVGVAYPSLERILNTSAKCQPHELPGIVKYLEDKRYIKVSVPEEPTLKPLQNSIIELSAHGVDLLEGSIPEDPGICI
ncbi:MAG: hypothetical protein RR482_02920 [Clostridia bacterium]